MKIIKNGNETFEVFVAMRWSSTDQSFKKDRVKLIFQEEEATSFIKLVKAVYSDFQIDRISYNEIDLVWALGGFLENHYKEIEKFDWRIGKILKISQIKESQLEIICECERWLN